MAALRRVGGVALALTLAVTACSKVESPRATTTSTPRTITTIVATTTVRAQTTPATTTTTTAPPPSVPPTVAPAAFSGTVTTVTAADLPSTYRPGCPVGPASLRMLHMTYWGFDGRAHLGTMVVNAAVALPVLTVFATLFHDRFPIRTMVPVDAYGGTDPASMAADNTSGFNCRTVAGSSTWSAHAYGEAIDVNPVENPYVEGGAVQPPAARAFLDRGPLRPGMAAPGTVVNNAFSSIGWAWGGRFQSPDYQHFSKTGN